ncbi:MAG: hypothetical protein LBR21_03815 [Propionibacteriaceae bacterium]|nr:hypothetical protein [Propionibacteriaceae bacterium]
MQVRPSELAPFMRSDAQARILAVVLLSDHGDLSLSQVAAKSGVPLTTVQREIARLSKGGIVSTRKLGQIRLVSANEHYPLLAPLSQIIAATYGPLQAVTDTFAGLPGMEKLFIFGSWAARISGTPGPFPADIDVLVVGSTSQLDAIERAIDASELVGREVNATVVSPERWEDGTDGFIADIKSKPTLELEVKP